MGRRIRSRFASAWPRRLARRATPEWPLYRPCRDSKRLPFCRWSRLKRRQAWPLWGDTCAKAGCRAKGYLERWPRLFEGQEAGVYRRLVWPRVPQNGWLRLWQDARLPGAQCLIAEQQAGIVIEAGDGTGFPQYLGESLVFTRSDRRSDDQGLACRDGSRGCGTFKQQRRRLLEI